MTLGSGLGSNDSEDVFEWEEEEKVEKKMKVEKIVNVKLLSSDLSKAA